MPDHGLSVMIRADRILLVRIGRREGVTRSADLADELSVEAAEMLAEKLVEAASEIRRRKADG